jgi:hypothetical protein
LLPDSARRDYSQSSGAHDARGVVRDRTAMSQFGAA